MKAIVLAAGLGTRLRPLSYKIPKVMFEVNGCPILEHNLLNLKKYGVRQIYINLHYKPEMIKNYFKNGNKLGLNIKYSYERKLLGTAGGVKKIAENFKRSFLVVYGDNFSNFNFRRFFNFHNAKKADISVVLFNRKVNPNSAIAGSSVTINNQNRIVKFIEGKNVSDLVSSAIYIISPKILKHIPSGRYFDFGKHLFPQLLKKNVKIFGYLMKGFVFGIDNLNCYNKMKIFFKERK